MKAKIINQCHVEKYTALTLDRDVPANPHNTYIIDGVAYDAVPYFALPVTGNMVMNVIVIQALGDFVGKTVLFELR